MVSSISSLRNKAPHLANIHIIKSVALFRVKMTRDIGVFVGRAIPGVGWIITAADSAKIAYRTIVKYNQIVKKEDRL